MPRLGGCSQFSYTCSQDEIKQGRGEAAASLLADRRTIAEGAFTAPVLRQAAAEAGVDMPVTAAVCRLLEGARVDEVIGTLLARPLRDEA